MSRQVRRKVERAAARAATRPGADTNPGLGRASVRADRVWSHKAMTRRRAVGVLGVQDPGPEVISTARLLAGAQRLRAARRTTARDAELRAARLAARARRMDATAAEMRALAGLKDVRARRVRFGR